MHKSWRCVVLEQAHLLHSLSFLTIVSYDMREINLRRLNRPPKMLPWRNLVKSPLFVPIRANQRRLMSPKYKHCRSYTKKKQHGKGLRLSTYWQRNGRFLLRRGSCKMISQKATCKSEISKGQSKQKRVRQKLLWVRIANLLASRQLPRRIRAWPMETDLRMMSYS